MKSEVSCLIWGGTGVQREMQNKKEMWIRKGLWSGHVPQTQRNWKTKTVFDIAWMKRPQCEPLQHAWFAHKRAAQKLLWQEETDVYVPHWKLTRKVRQGTPDMQTPLDLCCNQKSDQLPLLCLPTYILLLDVGARTHLPYIQTLLIPAPSDHLGK